MKNLRITIVTLMLIISLSISAQSLTIYCEDDKPIAFIGEDGKLTGFAVEVVHEIQKRVGNTDEIKMAPWARGLNEIDTKPDTMLFAMARNAERNPLYQWIGPIDEAKYGFFVRADSNIKITKLDDAKKVKSIGVYRGDIRDQYLTKEGFTNLERTKDNVANFKKLMFGRIDMYSSTPGSARIEAELAGFKFSDVKLAYIFMKTQLYIAASKGTNPAIITKWNKALTSMKQDGSFKAIYKKYFPKADLPGPAITTF